MNKIPKVIYTFWHSPDRPPIINKCIETWIYYNPDYQIIILSEDNFMDYCSGSHIYDHKHITQDNKTRISDFIRITIMATRGGIWLDASTICTGSLNFITENQKVVLYAMEYNDKYPVIENWFIACEPKNEFINMWYNEFINNSINYNSMDDYVTSNKEIISRDPWTGQYFAMHYAAQVLIQINKYDLTKITILDAVGFNGPLNIFNENDWSNEKTFDKLCYIDLNYPRPMIKLLPFSIDMSLCILFRFTSYFYLNII